MPRSDKHFYLVSAQNNNEKHLEFLQNEIRQISEILYSISGNDEFYVYQSNNVSFRDFFKQFNSPKFTGLPKILHFSGHSSKEEICLNNVKDNTGIIPANEFVEFLNMQDTVEIVFLNSCSSEGVGKELLKHSRTIQAVIETTIPVGDFDAFYFANLFYKGLAKGKTLKDAFDQACTQFSDKLMDYQKVLDPRSFGRQFNVNGNPTMAWQLSFLDEEFVATWRLTNPSIQDQIRDSRYNAKILCLFDEKDRSYYQAIEKRVKEIESTILIDAGKLFKINNSIEKNELIAESDGIILLIGLNFKLFFLNKVVGLIRQHKKPIKLVFCDGDYESNEKLIFDSSLTHHPITKSSIRGVYSLNYLSTKGASGVYNAVALILEKLHSFIESCSRGINIEKLQEKLEALNYESQRSSFEQYCIDNFEYNTLNFLLMEGTPKCGQNFLVKLLLNITDQNFFNNNIPINAISIKNNIPSEDLNRFNLWIQIRGEILDNKGPINIEGICKNLLDILNYRNLIILLNDWGMAGNAMKFELLVKQLWDDLLNAYNSLKKPPKKRLLLIISNSDFEADCSINKINIETDNCLILDPIENLKAKNLKYWVFRNKKEFNVNGPFIMLDNPEVQKKIISKGYMGEAIAEICKILGCEELSSELLKLA